MIKGYFVRTPLFVARNPKNSNPASVILGWKLFLGGGKSILRFFLFSVFFQKYTTDLKIGKNYLQPPM
jgi:hypothetical protein